ncbi:efflux transporter outer membrane subunit [Olivibacter domesticus]|uniref:Efflux transporter, outer membrane factor (OMF) lipoprotein, NodT family n=1 Tax=Olivibacter domesticus TaxID=407022 RepID=A0A1H7LZ22_OLID1|nr:efflux transporter outer membrane subunit [Olivibacter domesticus]SEL04260.1 efflux transporter, outer membrane factor (OMF) lipoprotein, NodT family [Olivibacter domesticus]
MAKHKYIWLFNILFILTSCSVRKQYERPVINVDHLYRSTMYEGDTTTMAQVQWKSMFADTVLQNFIEIGLQNNLDIQIAVQHIEEARALLFQSKAAFLPEISGLASMTQSRLAFPQGYGIINNATQYNVGLNASWEADIWGKLKSAKRKSLAALLQTESAKRAVQTQLIAEIAQTYYKLLTLDEQLIILNNTVSNRKKDMKTMNSLKEANVVNGADVVQSEANYYAAEIAVPAIKREIREAENALSLLLAMPSSPIKRQTLAHQSLNTDLRIGIPSQLLQNRPDLQIAEYALRMTLEDENAARANFYPAFNITASAGYTSYDLQQWFTPSGFFANIMGGLTQPIFNRSVNKTKLSISKIKKTEAYFQFKKSVLQAGKEVSDALYAYQTALTQQEIRTKQLKALQKAVDYNKKLLNYSSYTNYTDVLLAEQNLLAAQLDHINDQWLKWQSVITLYHALGGGWN